MAPYTNWIRPSGKPPAASLRDATTIHRGVGRTAVTFFSPEPPRAGHPRHIINDWLEYVGGREDSIGEGRG